MASSANPMLLIALLALNLAVMVSGAPETVLSKSRISFRAEPEVYNGVDYVLLRLEAKTQRGWIAVGLGTGMRKADVWMLSRENNQWNFSVRRSTAPSLPQLDTSQNVIFVNQSDDGRTVYFRRPAAAASSDTNAFSNFKQNFIYASYDTDIGSLSNSVHDSYGKFTYNIYGSTPGEITASALLLSHGIIMAISWSVLSFFGVFLARFLKRLFGRHWFNAHRGVLFLTVVLSIVALVLAVIEKNKNYNRHFDSVHGILGIVVIISSILQTVLGIVIDKMFQENRASIPFRDKLHWIFGFSLILTASANVIIGHLAFDSALWALVLNAVVISVWFIAFIASQFFIGHQHHNQISS